LKNERFYESHWILTIAGFVTVGYIIISIWKKQLSRDSLVNVFTTFMSAASILSGMKLMYITIQTKLIGNPINLEDSETVYTVIGGFAVSWMATWEVIKKFKE
jgi:ABC-type Mn2+/Zn2+ transport system permease subunit